MLTTPPPESPGLPASPRLGEPTLRLGKARLAGCSPAPLCCVAGDGWRHHQTQKIFTFDAMFSTFSHMESYRRRDRYASPRSGGGRGGRLSSLLRPRPRGACGLGDGGISGGDPPGSGRAGVLLQKGPLPEGHPWRRVKGRAQGAALPQGANTSR